MARELKKAYGTKDCIKPFTKEDLTESDGRVFDPETHTYYKDGQLVPSVTQVLPEIPDHLEYNLNFIEKTALGTRVHGACDLINQLILGKKKPKPVLTKKIIQMAETQEQDIPYIEGWIAYVKESGIQVLRSEMRVYSEEFCFAGTLDVLSRDKKGRAMEDIKTVTELKPQVALQLAGYLFAYNEEYGDDVQRRKAIQLKPDGTYRMKEYPVKELAYDTNVFLAKVTSKRWDMENGI